MIFLVIVIGNGSINNVSKNAGGGNKKNTKTLK
jgi:hypothetical protein